MEQETVKKQVEERIARRIVYGAKSNVGSKSGIVYVILAFFLCAIGLHNFYAGYVKRGLIQLLLTLAAPMFMFLPLLAVCGWGIIEMLFQNQAADGRAFRGNRGIIWCLRLLGLGFLFYSLMTTELIL